MSRQSRSNPRLDYKVFHQTGKKVTKLDAQYMKLAEKLDKDTIMERTQLVDENNMIVIEVEDFLEEYELDDLYGTEDIEKCILELKDLKKRFQGVHIKLKRVLGNEYKALYESYDNDVKKIVEWIKEARREISNRKREQDEEREEKLAREKEEKARKEEELARKEMKEMENAAMKERAKLKVEEKYFKIRVEEYLKNLDGEDSEFITDIEKNITELKYLIEIHSEMYARIEVVFGEDYENEFGDTYRKTLDSMNQCIQDEKSKIKVIRQAEKEKEMRVINLAKEKELREKKAQEERESYEKKENEKKYAEKVSFSTYMFEEIKSSASSLSK